MDNVYWRSGIPGGDIIASVDELRFAQAPPDDDSMFTTTRDQSTGRAGLRSQNPATPFTCICARTVR
jgi:hypothetical protein